MRYLLAVDTVGNVMLVDVVDDLRMPIGAPLPTASDRRSQPRFGVPMASGLPGRSKLGGD